MENFKHYYLFVGDYEQNIDDKSARFVVGCDERPTCNKTFFGKIVAKNVDCVWEFDKRVTTWNNPVVAYHDNKYVSFIEVSKEYVVDNMDEIDNMFTDYDYELMAIRIESVDSIREYLNTVKTYDIVVLNQHLTKLQKVFPLSAVQNSTLLIAEQILTSRHD